MNAFFALVALLAYTPAWSAGRLQVVTTTEDLAALAREVGKDVVDVQAIAKGYQDPHFVEAKPSFLVKLRRADLYIQIGLELEEAWAPALVQNARNPSILPGAPGHLDMSTSGVEILQKPDEHEGHKDRSHGDVHPFGNPHYWTDPENGRVMARAIAKRLVELAPDRKADVEANLAAFERALDAASARWSKIAAAFKGAKAVTYHNSWPNFTKRFGLDVVGFVEPRPGVPPSPAHIRALIEQIRRDKVPLILMETYWDAKVPQKIAAETGAKLVVFPASVGGKAEIRTYIELFDYDLSAVRDALEAK